MAKTDKKTTHGGSRQGAGRKARYDEPTTTVAFRLPISAKVNIDKMRASGVDVPRWLARQVHDWDLAHWHRQFLEKYLPGPKK